MNQININCKTGMVLQLSEINEFQGNLKDLSKENFEKLKSEIIETGFNFAPHVWQDPTTKQWYLADGHQRTRVLRQLVDDGWQCDPIPIVPVTAATLADAKRLVLQGTSAYGEMTKDGLYEFLNDAQIPFEDVETSFRFPEIDFDEFKMEFGEVEGQCDEDEVPPPLPTPISKIGDLYELGNHRLLCGDSTKIEDVERLMAGQKADMIFTDPPYGVSYADKNAFLNALSRGNCIQERIENDHMEPDKMNEFWFQVLSNLHGACSDRASYYICSPQGGDLMMMMMSIIRAKWQLKHMLIWVKNNHVLGRCDYNYKHEPILYGWKENGTHEFVGAGRCKTSVWDFDKPLKNDLHPTMKPVELCGEAILNSSKENQIVIDTFLGSGSTLIACEKTNRKCFGLEIDPHYVDVIVSRWCKYTGQTNVTRNGEPIEWAVPS